MRFDLLVRGGTVVSSLETARCDIGVRDGKIAAVGDLTGAEAAEVVDANGLHVLPGLIDSQVHFREPGLEHKEDLESGTRCALYGGVTTVFEMPNTEPPTITAELLADKLRRAEGRTWANADFFIGAAKENIPVLGELERLPGTPGVKIFMGSSTGSLLVDRDEDLLAVLAAIKGPCAIHAEDEDRLRARKPGLEAAPHPRRHPWARDVESASLATQRLFSHCEATGCRVHLLHVSTAAELPMIAEAKRRRLPVTAEVTPQHLTLTDDDYETLGTFLQMNPPVRDEGTRQALWHAVRTGIFDVFGSDHAPHTREEKALPYPKSPSGMPGVQTMLPLLLDHAAAGRLTVRDIVRMLAETPARLFRLPTKGRIVPDFDADLALVDLDAETVVEAGWLQSKCGWSPFEGRKLRGKVVHTVVSGVWSLRDGVHHGKPAGRMPLFADRK